MSKAVVPPVATWLWSQLLPSLRRPEPPQLDWAASSRTGPGWTAPLQGYCGKGMVMVSRKLSSLHM